MNRPVFPPASFAAPQVSNQGFPSVNQTSYRMNFRFVVLAALLAIVAFESANVSLAWSQDDASEIDAADIRAIMNDQDEVADDAPLAKPSRIDMLSLIASGGKFMIPIGIMSLLVVTLAVERMVTLRRNNILPRRLTNDIEDLIEPINSFNPSLAYQSCLDHPSPAARVIGAMMLRTGQPLAEIERTASDTVQREADRYSSTVRWLNLAAAATPLMGLLGTVWGMIVAFHESSTLTADRSRSEQLSEGIYTALVTTLAGLIVAIPAAILAQYLENRVIKLFHQIEQLAFDLAPGLARFTSRQRMDVDGSMHAIEAIQTAPGVRQTSRHSGDSTASPLTPPPAPPLAPPPRTAIEGGRNEGSKRR